MSGDHRDTKFRLVGASTFGSPNQYTSTSRLASKDLRKYHYTNLTKPILDSGVNNTKSKPFTGTTEYSNNFVDYVKEIRKLDTLSDEQLRQAFDSADKNKSGFIERSEINTVLGNAFGDIPALLRKQLMGIFDSNQDGKISLQEFVNAVRLAGTQNKNNCTMPGTVTKHAKPLFEQKKKDVPIVITNKVDKSLMATDVGNNGGIKDLDAGSTRATGHIPGYSGSIPRSNYNASKMTEKKRPVKENLILNETYAPKIKIFDEVRYGEMMTTSAEKDEIINRFYKKK